MTPEDITDTRARLDKAIDLVCALAAGDERFRMSVPANEEKDTDLILCYALAEGRALLSEIEHLKAENYLLRQGRGGTPETHVADDRTPLHLTHPIENSQETA